VKREGATTKTFVTLQEAMSDPAMREQVLAEAKIALKSWKKNYSNLKELAAVYEAIEKVV
jgi:hypothetical protein